MKGKFLSPERVFFGFDSINYLTDLTKDAEKVLIITTKGRLKDGCIKKALLKIKKKCDIYNNTTSEPTTKSIVECAEKVKEKDYDILIGIGGGSCLDTTKIVAVMSKNNVELNDLIGIDKIRNDGIKTILLPTTAGSGSEATFIAVFRDELNSLKKSIISEKLLSFASIVDPQLTLTLPNTLTAYTGIDAFIHAIEAFLSKGSNEITDILAIKSMELIRDNIVEAFRDGTNRTVRYNMSLASLLAGMAETNAGVGGIHALSYPIESLFKVQHGLSNGILLPYVLEFNYTNNEKFKELSTILCNRGSRKGLISKILEIRKSISIPNKFDITGLNEDSRKLLAELAIKNERLLKNNPKDMELNDILQIYKKAIK